MSWQIELLEHVQSFSRTQPSLSELWVFGSAAHPELLDRWSDVDLGLALSGELDLDPLMASIGEIWTVESTSDDSGSTHRLIFTDGRRLDLVAGRHAAISQKGGRLLESRHPTKSRNATPSPAGETANRLMVSRPPVADEVLHARFLAGQAAVKLGRGDHLIGTHLALEFAQLCLIQAMVLRDRDEAQTSHRFGTHRDDLAEQILQASRREVGPAWLDALVELASVFDRLRAELDPTYHRDWSGLRALVGLSEQARPSPEPVCSADIR